MKIRVSNIDRSTSDDELYGLFEEFGDVVSVEINAEPDPGVDTFTAWVTMDYEDDALEAISELNGEWVDGKSLRVSDGSNQPETPSEPIEDEEEEGLMIGGKVALTKGLEDNDDQPIGRTQRRPR